MNSAAFIKHLRRVNRNKDHWVILYKLDLKFRVNITFSGASLIVQLVKNLLAMQETLVRFMGQEIHWKRDRLPIPVLFGFPCGSAGKESSCNVGDLGLIPEFGRSPGEGKGYPLLYSGLENSMDCIVHGVTKSWTWLSDSHSLREHWISFHLFVSYSFILFMSYNFQYTDLLPLWLNLFRRFFMLLYMGLRNQLLKTVFISLRSDANKINGSIKQMWYI